MSSPENIFISIPPKFENILKRNQPLYHDVGTLLSPYSKIFDENAHVFFPGYTDHGIKHINSVLADEEILIPSAILKKLSPEEIGVLVLATVFHDIGMQASPEVFKNMLEGKYDSEIKKKNYFNEKKWIVLWNEYTKEYHYWDSEKKVNVFGDKDCFIEIPKVDKLNNLNKNQEKFIGEFIRLHHCRNAHEIANRGYKANETIGENKDVDLKKIVDLAGLVARSHGMDMRNTFPYLKAKYVDDWKEPLGIHVVYLMSLLRIADALQIYKSRTSKEHLATHKIDSPYSEQEHKMHLAFENLSFKKKEETIKVQADPKDAKTYVRCENEIKKIQWELDRTWAILGEVYRNDYTLNYRRIQCVFINQVEKDFVPQKFCYKFNDSLAKKLVGPLYGNEPSFGVRELVQNAVDACRESKRRNSKKNPPHVVVELDTKKNIFTITDTGKGMTLEEIQKYFLTIGSSFNDNIDWKKWRDDNNVYRSGRFGIGVLAAFLLGDKICVETRSEETKTGYSFEAELGEKFIEIKKINKRTYGTKITIKCNSECVEKLKEEAELENKQYGTDKWYGWYIGEEPGVTYYYDGTPIIPNRDKLKGFLELKHHSENFGIIRWKPRFMGGAFLYCNGFFITPHANKHLFTDDDERYVISGYPHLQITDKYNKLPINLQRTNIESDAKYTFENQLKKEICKDVICQMMSISYDNIKSNIAYRFKAYHKSGFTLYNEYTKRILSSKNFKIVYIDYGTNLTLNGFEIIRSIINMEKYSNCIFINCDILEFDNSPNTAICYNDSYISNNSPYNIKQKIEGYNKNKIYKGFNISSTNETYMNFFKSIIDLLSEMNFNPNDIFMQIIEIDKNKLILKQDLEDLFKYYIGENIFIPWDIKEREKKYPNIYSDKKLVEKIKEYKDRYLTNISQSIFE